MARVKPMMMVKPTSEANKTSVSEYDMRGSIQSENSKGDESIFEGINTIMMLRKKRKS